MLYYPRLSLQSNSQQNRTLSPDAEPGYHYTLFIWNALSVLNVESIVWQYIADPPVEKLNEHLKERHIIVDAILLALQNAFEPLTINEAALKTGYSRKTCETTLYELAKVCGAVRHAWLRGNKKLDVDSLTRFPSVQRWLSELKAGPGRKLHFTLSMIL